MPKAFSEHEREVLKGAMLNVGSILIRKKGIRQVTIEDITKGVDIAKGSFYAFYNSREEFFWDIIKHEEKQLLEKIKVAAEEDIPTKIKVQKIFYDIFLQANCLVFYLPPADMQYIVRKLPLELMQTDMENGSNMLENLLSMCGVAQVPRNAEMLMTMIHTLQFVASNEQLQSEIIRKKLLSILVEAFSNHLTTENKGGDLDGEK